MKYQHESIKVAELAPGNFVITGHQPKPVQTEGGRFVPLDVLHITPEVPSELLFAILESRGEFQQTGTLISIVNMAADLPDSKTVEFVEHLAANLAQPKSEAPAKKVHWKTAQKQARETAEAAQ